MDSVSMQLPQVCPLQAPDVWLQWVTGLDSASWILYANALIASFDPLALSHEELLLVSELIDRRDAMLQELPASFAGENAH